MLYRYPPRTIPGSHIIHISKAKPYPRPNEGLFEYSDEVSQMGLGMGPEWVQNRPQNDPPGTPPRLVPRWPLRPSYPDLRNLMVQNRHFIVFY